MAQPFQPVRGSHSGRPIMALLDLLGERWALRIIWELRSGEAMSFRELRAACGDLSPTVLNKRLHELREAQIISLNEGYQLTEEGADFAGSPVAFERMGRALGKARRAAVGKVGFPPYERKVCVHFE